MGWPLKEKDLKHYPHFDGYYSLEELTSLATDPARVASHTFLPFLLYEKVWRPFQEAGIKRKKKLRPIRYASRRDSAIFSYYRHVLSEKYEAALRNRGVESCPIAYRKIPAADGSSRGMCNIDFAAQAFARVRELGTCCAVTLDISKFFEYIDHKRLHTAWCELLGQKRLPPDHYAVFRAVAQYAVVERNAAYERLGYIGPKASADGQEKIGFLKHWRKMPLQLCTMPDFRRKICGDDKACSKLVVVNTNSYGIPQGAPLSDLLANIYLLEFDERVHRYVRERGGVYYRYSDDILVLLPGGEADGHDAARFVGEEIHKCGEQLKIKNEKTAIVCFAPNFAAQFGRVRDFDTSVDHRRWTFRTYIKRCTQVFGDSRHIFYRQARHHRRFIQRTAHREINRALRMASS